MSDLSKKTLDNLAALAKLYIKDNEYDKLSKDLNNILGMVDQIQNIDTTHVKTMAHPLDIKQPLREDKAEDNTMKSAYQSLSQHIVDDMYQVPKVLD